MVVAKNEVYSIVIKIYFNPNLSEGDGEGGGGGGYPPLQSIGFRLITQKR